MKEKVIVSRNWHNPKIEIWVSNQEVGSKMELDDFIAAMLAEVGSPTMVMTKAQLKAKIDAAKDIVLEHLRASTIHIV